MISIPRDQKCQAFDPMMILPEKTYRILKNHMVANTSCFAPASIFVDGIHGKRYLCDYHYQYEKNITVVRTPDLWPLIAENVIDEREKIKETFSKNTTTNETLNNYCWCKKQAFVKIINKKIGSISFFCNFHFRKFYYRNYSNCVIFEDIYQILDERYKMTMSVIEEAEQSDLIV
jgi:hypothetical protein